MKNPYAVGYGKPPGHTRFVKGKSGNPKGRPPRARNFKTVLERELDSEIVLTEGGKRRKATKREAFAKSLTNKAIQADGRSQSNLLSALDRTGMLNEADTGGQPLPAVQRAILERWVRRRLLEAGGASADVNAILDVGAKTDGEPGSTKPAGSDGAAGDRALDSDTASSDRKKNGSRGK